MAMGKSTLTSIFVLTILLYSVGAARIDNPDAAKLEILKRNSKAAANAVRKIVIRSPYDQVQLASMANDFAFDLNLAAYPLNNVIPNIANENEYGILVSNVQVINAFANDISKSISGNSGKLKDKLVATLEGINQAVTRIETFKSSNKYITTQLLRRHRIFISAVDKLRYQSLLLGKTNKELNGEIGISVATLIAAIRNAPTDKAVEDELRSLFRHLPILTAKAIDRLDNWVELNPSKGEDVKTIQEISNILSGLYDKMNRAVNGNYGVVALKAQLLEITESVQKQTTRLALVEYPDKSGGQEFIRNSLFEALAIGRTYAESIKNL